MKALLIFVIINNLIKFVNCNVVLFANICLSKIADNLDFQQRVSRCTSLTWIVASPLYKQKDIKVGLVIAKEWWIFES